MGCEMRSVRAERESSVRPTTNPKMKKLGRATENKRAGNRVGIEPVEPRDLVVAVEKVLP